MLRLSIFFEILLKNIGFDAPNLAGHNLRTDHVHIQGINKNIVENFHGYLVALGQVRRHHEFLDEDVFFKFDVARGQDKVGILVDFGGEFL